MKNGNNGQPEEIEELLHAIQNGSSGAFVKLSELYAPLLNKEVSRYADSLGDADLEDLRQGASISLYRAALAYRADRGVTFGLFAKICITNRLVDRLRALERYWKNEGKLGTGPEDPDVTPDPAEGADPAARLMDNEAVRALNAIIDRHLSVYEQRVFRMYLSGYAAGEIASAMGREEKSVSNAIDRIRRKLKALLNTL